MIAGYGNGFNSPSFTNDKLWINERNSNNFLSVNLIGTSSNRSAVGTVIELHGAWGTMIREVRAGESYGVSNSLSQIFGLGVHYTIQSLIIKWPSGVVSTYTDIDANQLLTISESGCHPINIILSTNGNTTL